MKKLLFLILFIVPSNVSADCSIEDILAKIRPRAWWTMTGPNYSNLVWTDPVQPMPSASEVQNAITACQTRSNAKSQAHQDVKNQGVAVPQRLQDLLILLDLDQ